MSDVTSLTLFFPFFAVQYFLTKSKSANLSIYEYRLEQAVTRNAHIPEDLAKTGELHLNRREINVEVGRLYLLNNAINLETNLLDTPEEFWEGMFVLLSHHRILLVNASNLIHLIALS